MFGFQKGGKSFETVSLCCRRTRRTACCSTAEKTNTAVETLPLWLWCEASYTSGEENSDSPISSDSQMCGWWIKAADKTLELCL